MEMGTAITCEIAGQPEPREAGLRELLAAIASRDQAALARFYDQTIGRVYGIALRITRRSEAAEEVAEDVYLQVWREAGRYDQRRGAVLAWLLTLARSRALDHLRSTDRAISEAEPERYLEQCGEGDPQDLLLALERSTLLHGAMARLASLERQLIALAFFRGLTHEEIARYCAMPLGSVKTRIRRALATLRETLAPKSMSESTK